MDPKIEQLLQMMTQPVFFVKDRIIQWHNDAAGYLVGEGQTIASVLTDGMELYLQWDRQGPMQMSISIFGIDYNAKARVLEEGELFVLERTDKDWNENGNSLVHISAHMRRILQELVSSLTALHDQMAENQVLPRETELLNRSVYRLLRLCTQISDGGNLMNNGANSFFEMTNIREFLDKFFNEAAPLLKDSGWNLEYIPCDEEMVAYLDSELIERALYNLVSNGIRWSSPNGSVCMEAWEARGLICFSVSYEAAPRMLDAFFAESSGTKGSNFSWDGLGTDVVRLIAELHGGSVLSSASEEERKVRTVFTIRKHSNRFGLHSSMMFVRESMSFHHGLVALSEVLDSSLYHPDKV